MRNFSFLFQKRCINCHVNAQHEYMLCEDCLDKLVFVDGYRDIDDSECYFSLMYQKLAKKLIYDYKLNKKEVIKYVLSDILIDKIKEKNLSDYTLVIVPSTRKTIANRGFDHVHEIAREISGQNNMDYLEGAIKKTRETKIQHNLSQMQRYQNLKGAFAIETDLSDKKILVVDDIVTTKNTLCEIKRTLNGKYLDLKFIAVASRANEKYKMCDSVFDL